MRDGLEVVPAQSHKLYDASSSLAPATMAKRFQAKRYKDGWAVYDTVKREWRFADPPSSREDAKWYADKLNKMHEE